MCSTVPKQNSCGRVRYVDGATIGKITGIVTQGETISTGISIASMVNVVMREL